MSSLFHYGEDSIMHLQIRQRCMDIPAYQCLHAVKVIVQPVTSSDQLELDQSMKESEIIVANRTHWLSNRRCESSEDKAPVSESSGRTGVRASNRAVASCQALVSIVNTTAGIRFKRNNECGEAVITC